jgi:hypothetical protein
VAGGSNRDLTEERTAWSQRIHATLFHQGVPSMAHRLSSAPARAVLASEPQARPSMADMAQELQACTAEPPEASEPAGLDQLSARVSALTAATRHDVADARVRRNRVDAAWHELRQAVTDAASELAGLLEFELRESGSGYRATAMLGHPPFSPHDGRDLGCLLLPPG